MSQSGWVPFSSRVSVEESAAPAPVAGDRPEGRGGWLPFRAGLVHARGQATAHGDGPPFDSTRGITQVPQSELIHSGGWTPRVGRAPRSSFPRAGVETRHNATREPLGDAERIVDAGQTDYPYRPPQRFVGAMPPLAWSVEPIRRGLRERHFHYRVESGMGASRFLSLDTLRRVVAGSHETGVRGGVSPVRMRTVRQNRLTRGRVTRSFSEQTETID